MGKIRETMNRFLQGRYGYDELGKLLLIVGVVFYFLGTIFRSSTISLLGSLVMFYELFRLLSKKHWDRGEENRKYLKYKKLWKLRFEERSTSRIFLCKSCGKFIRVPKGKGKIQITCPTCGHSSVHRT
ncbi:hypothetical protein [Ohessyouella blattaphilus]|uniref:Zn-finger containing protein n=1 Tax=Ohessyouella blattaphilus TaxID=2949333 RepID=A0ABT1EJA7_9FIRM|nr:hypothetical protein [Ohessyouella blattaphilus]MCP1110773.1 hypothetical protein [Ohessyouella blattaphilus]MCR8564167.1 hypothetical protein [Ohessyouella blattaphilus]MDL2250034.1 hypothetical protein [Lachnospiraceae bacterium OttesenSCG-928-J05]